MTTSLPSARNSCFPALKKRSSSDRKSFAAMWKTEVIRRYVEDGSYRDGENSIVMIEKETVME